MVECGNKPQAKERYKSASNLSKRPILISGGAGFIGSNVANHFLEQGYPVAIFDNLSRPGVTRNLQWLLTKFGSLLDLTVSDIRNAHAIREAVRQADRVFHFAAQVAVTTSLTHPELDFEVNAKGTLNVLEAIRTLSQPPPLLFTSTSKVYGDLCDLELTGNAKRYEPVDPKIQEHGLNESRSLNLQCPYGCSKGVADQYVLEYARNFDLPAVVFRMSCIYGPHQMGTEDQGWVAHFAAKALGNQHVTIYGDGRQVRDLLFVDDLVQAMAAAMDSMNIVRGRAFNIGGGLHNAVSVLEAINMISEIQGAPVKTRNGPWRRGDQRYYISDISAFNKATGWSPSIRVPIGMERLYDWFKENIDIYHSRFIESSEAI